jgi:hypothetical protein
MSLILLGGDSGGLYPPELQQFSLWKFCPSLLRILSIAILESPILSFKIGHLGQDAGQNENCCLNSKGRALRATLCLEAPKVPKSALRPGSCPLIHT